MLWENRKIWYNNENDKGEKYMLHIGAHLSASKGYLAMGKEALSIDADTFQFFTRNPRGGKAKALDLEDIDAFLALRRDYGFTTILAHAPYTVNPCSSKEEARTFAKEIIADDLRRLEHIPNSLYNFHPGSHTGQGVDLGIEEIVAALNENLTAEQTTTVLLETMAGKGTEIGSAFEELERIIAGVERQEKMGVCLDTCHVFDAGYDIKDHLEDVLEDFDKHVGLKRLKAIHINDSMYGLGSHKDRHAKIGEGKIGLEAFVRIINHQTFKDLPFFLETPNDVPGYGKEIALLKSHYNG